MRHGVLVGVYRWAGHTSGLSKVARSAPAEAALDSGHEPAT